MRKQCWPLWVLWLVPFLFFAAQAADEPLPPEQAFKFSASARDAQTIVAEWAVADGYYLYHDKFRFESDTPGIKLGEPSIPAGKKKQDPFFGEVETHRNKVRIELPLQRSAGSANEIRIKATSQGCADLGLCYPPYETVAAVALPSAAPTAAAAVDPVQSMTGAGNGFGLEDASEEFLDPDAAFVLSTEPDGSQTVLARWQIADGYYLYRDKFQFTLKQAPDGLRLGTVELPRGEPKDDEFFGRIEVFHNEVTARLPLSGNASGQPLSFDIGYQGCAEAGLCYPPIVKTVNVTLPPGAAGAASAAVAPPAALIETQTRTPVTEQDQLVLLLEGGDAWAIVGLFFLAGLGLALTPCVFPMIPILSGIIVGHGTSLTTRKAFVLSLVYVLAMAVTYTAAGVVAGLFGENLQATFQNPWILSAFAVVFVALALSMFGFYDIQMPSFLQSKLTEISNRQKGGTLSGVAAMGFLSALIVGPCVAAPLAGALIFIGNTGDAVLGGTALFALSMGMGAPLIAIGTSHGKFMPKAGPWMDSVKAVFGVLMLAVAIWMLERILPGQLIMLLWALLLIISAVYMGALQSLLPEATGWRKLWKGVGVSMLVYGALLMIGAGTGSTDPLQPLDRLSATSTSGGATAGAVHALDFRPVKSLEDLQREVAAASAQGKPTMLDFYADWCISCKEFEKYTFSDSGVQQALADAVVLQADVTANDAIDKALLKHYKLLGPPTIMFFDRNGMERKDYRVVGFMGAEEFRTHVARAIP